MNGWDAAKPTERVTGSVICDFYRELEEWLVFQRCLSQVEINSDLTKKHTHTHTDDANTKDEQVWLLVLETNRWEQPFNKPAKCAFEVIFKSNTKIFEMKDKGK